MATLVLSTAGTALGGPVGGLIGSIVGQSIDGQLLGPGPREGPRLDDLRVQTSSYGTQIPRVYGRMRVAGSVVWATELKETGTLEGGGKAGLESLGYTYSVSFAVALSSRRAAAVRRIWADGKLLRGAAGDFKVRCAFRFYSGDEDQPVDPLIASIEGMGATPAYRGLALAVFEDLELAEFGNRIPFLTFELDADAGSVSLSELLGDASGGAIACSSEAALGGYAAYGASKRAAVDVLVEHFGVDLVDNGEALVSPPQTPVVTIAASALGTGAEAEPKIERSHSPARSLPGKLTVSYYDADRDYQSGAMTAHCPGALGSHARVEMPAVLAPEHAKALAEQRMARSWAERDRLKLRLPLSFAILSPGSPVAMEGSPIVWKLEQITLEDMASVVTLKPFAGSFAAAPADGGRRAAEADFVAGPTSLALFDLPHLGQGGAGQALLYLAAAKEQPGWRSLPIEIGVGEGFSAARTASAETVMGRATSFLPAGESFLFDLVNHVDVELIDEEDWLQSCDDDALVSGANAAALGSEIVQFGSAVPIGARKFRLSRLLRGRRGTEWAASGHAVGEAFALLQPSALKIIELPPAAIGSTITVTAHGPGDGEGTGVTSLVHGEALRPPSPIHLSAVREADGSLELAWVRRSRAGWAWLDEVDVPLAESNERYRVRLSSASGSAEVEVSSPTHRFSTAELAGVGAGPLSVSVVQIGDFAASRPATLTIPS